MPPAVSIGAAAGTTVSGNNDLVFAPIASQKPGDAQLVIMASDTTGQTINPAFNTLGWVLLTEVFSIGGASIVLARREVKSSDPATIPFRVTTNPGWQISVLMTYRALNNAAALLEASATGIAASTNFVCPSRALVNYSDLYLGVVVVTSAVAAVTPPAGTTERYEVAVGGGPRELEVFEFLAEATGATGTKTATIAANQSGTAASFALAGQSAPGFGKSFALSPIGTFGLPQVGI